MGKPRMLGMKSSYIPNARADRLNNRKLYQRGREIAVRDTDDIKQRKDQKRMEDDKLGILEVQSNR